MIGWGQVTPVRLGMFSQWCLLTVTILGISGLGIGVQSFPQGPTTGDSKVLSQLFRGQST